MGPGEGAVPGAGCGNERLQSVIGAPAPVGIDRPERDVGEDDDRSARGLVLEIIGEPSELVGS
jgi:hypothetical protein